MSLLGHMLDAPKVEHHVVTEYIGGRLRDLDALLELRELSVATTVALEKECAEVATLVDVERDDPVIASPDGSVVTVGCLIFLLWSRIRLVLHDAEWCAEDGRYRQSRRAWANSPILDAELRAATPFAALPMTHPRYEYTQSELRQALGLLLVARAIVDLPHTRLLYGLIVDRVCIMLHYAMSSATLDVDEYADNSVFLYDCYFLVSNINRKLANNRAYDRQCDTRFDNVLDESRAHRAAWSVGMILTAAGDDLASVYKVQAVEMAVERAERHIHGRSHGAGDGYNILVETRGRECAVALNHDADNFIIELIHYEIEEDVTPEEYSVRAHVKVAERYAQLDGATRNTLDGVLFNYTAKRILAIDFYGHVLADRDNGARVPTLRRVCYTDKCAMLDATGGVISVFGSVADAFAVWLWWIQYYHSGVVYHPDTHAEIECSGYIKELLWGDG